MRPWLLLLLSERRRTRRLLLTSLVRSMCVRARVCLLTTRVCVCAWQMTQRRRRRPDLHHTSLAPMRVLIAPPPPLPPLGSWCVCYCVAGVWVPYSPAASSYPVTRGDTTRIYVVSNGYASVEYFNLNEATPASVFQRTAWRYPYKSFSVEFPASATPDSIAPRSHVYRATGVQVSLAQWGIVADCSLVMNAF